MSRSRPVRAMRRLVGGAVLDAEDFTVVEDDGAT